MKSISTSMSFHPPTPTSKATFSLFLERSIGELRNPIIFTTLSPMEMNSELTPLISVGLGVVILIPQGFDTE